MPSVLASLEKNPPNFSIVLETENLGMAGMDDLKDTLASLLEQTYSVKHATEVLIIAAGHVSEAALASLRAAYPWLTVHREADKLEYMQSKRRGAEIATGDIVVYADSDVVYEPTWLASLLSGFILIPEAGIVSGETRIRGRSIYSTAIQLSWMIRAKPVLSRPERTDHFHLNNFAIRREFMLGAPVFLGIPLYRASVVELKRQLFTQGALAVRVPNACGWHLPPGTLADWWWRMLIYGADSVAKADFRFAADGTVTESPAPLRKAALACVFWLFRLRALARRGLVLVRERPGSAGLVLAAVPAALFFIGIEELGALAALVNRDAIYARISARENAHVA